MPSYTIGSSFQKLGISKKLQLLGPKNASFERFYCNYSIQAYPIFNTTILSQSSLKILSLIEIKYQTDYLVCYWASL